MNKEEVIKELEKLRDEVRNSELGYENTFAIRCIINRLFPDDDSKVHQLSNLELSLGSEYSHINLIYLIDTLIREVKLFNNDTAENNSVMSNNDEVENIVELQNRYKYARSGKDTANLRQTIEFYFEWYNAAYKLFSQYFDDKDKDFVTFSNVDNDCNGYGLNSNFNVIQKNVIVMLDKIKNNRIEIKSGKFSQSVDNNIVVDNNKIFIVHGQDEAMKLDVARFVEKIGLEAVILNEQSNNGKTVIEKLEENSNVGFAIVLLSPCDEGRKAGTNEFKPRARQNVIVELGYFVGKLGRNKVFILKKSDVEEPSDFTGVVYTDYDKSGGWIFSLLKDLKSAGYEIDMNKII